MLTYRKIETGSISKEGSNPLAVNCICLTQFLLCNYYVIKFDTDSRDAFAWKQNKIKQHWHNQIRGSFTSKNQNPEINYAVQG